jgi:hypothetical protein
MAAGMKEPRFLGIILGKQSEFSLEKRILNAVVLSSGIITLLILFEAIVLQWTLQSQIITAITALVFWGIFVFSRKHPGYNWPMWLYLGVNSVIICVDWFFLSGQAGLARSLLVSIAAIVPLVTKKKQISTGGILLFIVYTALITGSVFFWQMMPSRTPTLNSAMEYLLEVGILALSMLVVTYLAVNSYRTERHKSIELNKALLQINEILEARNRELESALQEVKTLQGILPICAYCKKIRNDKGYWDRLEKYLAKHTGARMSHGICPECMKKYFPEVYKKAQKDGRI